MSSITKRFGYYFFGVILGIAAVFFMFGSRTDIRCSYFPNSRVLSNLSQKQVEFSALAECQKNCLQLDSIELRMFFIAGAINFSTSEPRKKPFGEYDLTYRTQQKQELKARVQNQDSTVVFLSIVNAETNCTCN